MITIDSCYNEVHDDLTFNVIGATIPYGAKGRDLCPSLPPPFEEVLGAPWVGKTMRSPWKGRTYPGDPWGSSLPFIGPTQAFPVNVNPGVLRSALQRMTKRAADVASSSKQMVMPIKISGKLYLSLLSQ